ncbi:hypothetical protein SAMN05216304_102287 [Bosea sp. OK403]|uniref:hypothetical protein n=1 Tax=Bosea sp. OK403 TaxID=1855286 RepID=UPI0008F4144C|nr:hypothetical protein [Bosea sp. OK403]SFI33089.1 hypothetical protein SAMN05216304_102287 [Bosea sp. OK403]
MGQAKPFHPELDTASHLFLVGRSTAGFWVARDLEGRSEGIFRDKKDAVRFALFEGGHPNAVMLSPNAVEPSFGMGVR